MIKFLRGLNLPNRLTLLRVAAIPLFFLFLLLPGLQPLIPGLAGTEKLARIFASIFFLGAAITDMMDGKIARKYGLVTELGKFLDPIADKLMVFAAFFGLLCLERGDFLFQTLLAVSSLLTLTREFAVTGLRTMASADSGGKIIPANGLGKTKTVGQIVFVLCALLEPVVLGWLLGELLHLSFFATLSRIRLLTYASMAFMTVMTVVSGINYFTAYVSSKKRKD